VNADTTSLIFEVALIQWPLLRHNHLDYELMTSGKPEFVEMLTAIVGNRKTVILNPLHILPFKRHHS
jgi:hypothetical protein